MKSSKAILTLASVLLLGAAGLGVWLRLGTTASTASSAPHSAPLNPRPPPNHPVVARIVKEGSTMPYLKFNYLIKEIPTDLAAHDIHALLGFITARAPERFSEGEWGSLTNDIQEALTVQTIPNPEVAQTLIDTYRDTTRSQLMRDYALQHIGGFAIYLIHTGTPASTDPSSSSTIFQPLFTELLSATRDPSKPWAGTALNLLDGLLRAAEYRNVEIPGLSAESLATIALPIASDASVPLNSRLPALQLAARRNAPGTRELAREILTSSAPGTMLVQSASAALARLGTPEDLTLLQSLAATADRHTAPAIQNAIQSIQSKN